MKFLNKLSCAFSAGCVGAIALLIALILWRGMPHSLAGFKADIYRLMVWGGIWALLMVIPIWKTHWFIRGSVLGIIVILFNFLILMPMTGHGFFASKAGGTLFIANIILNYIWGVIASAWFRLCSY